MSNALTQYSFNDTMNIAKVLIASEMLPKAIKTPEQAFVIITMGESLGLNMWQAINGINVIAGKPTVSGQLMLALMYRTGEVEDIQIESSDTVATVTIKRKGRPSPHREVFTIEDAQRLMTVEWVNNQKKTIRLSEKSTWQQMPGTMLKWRAVAAAARVVFPDAIMGLYTPDEMGADVTVTEDGDMQVINAPALPPVVERPAEPEILTGKLTHITHCISEKTSKSYYRFNGGVFTFTRQPFRDAGLTICETWANLPINETFEMPDGVSATVKQVGNDRYEIVSVEVRS